MGLKILQIIATIEFLKNKVVQLSSLDTNLKWRGKVPGEGKWSLQVKCLVNSPRCYHLEILWVSRSLENPFATIADLKMVSDTDAHTKPALQSPYTFMWISLYIILLTQNSISSKIDFPWSRLHLELF